MTPAHPAARTMSLRPHAPGRPNQLMLPPTRSVEGDRHGESGTYQPEDLVAAHPAPVPANPDRPVVRLARRPLLISDEPVVQGSRGSQPGAPHHVHVQVDTPPIGIRARFPHPGGELHVVVLV